MGSDDRHYVHCPNCEADFATEGRKPLKMACPSCGEEGVLE